MESTAPGPRREPLDVATALAWLARQLRSEEVRSRLSMALTLVATSGFPVVLLALRARMGGGLGFRFLLWNLFLAWVPLGFAFVAEFGWRRHWSRRSLLWPLGGWLLFFPNAPYVVTDVIHLEANPISPLWFDALILFSIGLAGLLVGFVSLRIVQLIVNASFSRRTGWIVSLGVLSVSGFGIYLGRFGRYNSWDILSSPRRLLYDVQSVALDPVSNSRTLAISAVFAAFLTVTYVGTIALGRLVLPWRPPPPD